jgi:hypothetical protein
VERAPEERVDRVKEALRAAVKRAGGEVDQQADEDEDELVLWDKSEGPPPGWQQQGSKWSKASIPGQKAVKQLRWTKDGEQLWWQKRYRVLYLPNIR